MRTLTRIKDIHKLYAEFPALALILDAESATDLDHFKISFEVSVATPEMLFLIPRFCLAPHWIGSADDKYIGRVMPRAYAFDDSNNLIGYITWDYDTPNQFMKAVIPPTGAKTVIYRRKYMWWHNVSNWLETGKDTPVGQYSHSEYQFFIFKEPKQGFAKLIAESDLRHNVHITDLLQLGMASYSIQGEAADTMRSLESIKDQFKRSIGRQVHQVVKKCRRAGMSGTFGTTQLMTFCTAGRIMFSFWRGGHNFTMVGDESDFTRTGLQSLDCTVDEAVGMVNEVVANWTANSLKPDDNVNMI